MTPSYNSFLIIGLLVSKWPGIPGRTTNLMSEAKLLHLLGSQSLHLHKVVLAEKTSSVLQV